MTSPRDFSQQSQTANHDALAEHEEERCEVILLRSSGGLLVTVHLKRGDGAISLRYAIAAAAIL